MALLPITEHSDLEKTRRSLYVVSIFTLIVANARFSGDYLVIFSLRVHFVPEDLVALGRFSVAILLLIFLLHTMTQVFGAFSGAANSWFSKGEKSARNEMHEMEHQLYGQDYNEREPESWEIWFGNEYDKKSRLVSYILRSEIVFEAIKKGFIGYFLVILLSVSALWRPTALKEVVDVFRIAEVVPVPAQNNEQPDWKSIPSPSVPKNE